MTRYQVELPKTVGAFLKKLAKQESITVEEAGVTLLYSTMLDLKPAAAGPWSINQKAKTLAVRALRNVA